MTDQQPRELAEVLKGTRFVMVTTVRADQTLASRPMTIQEVEGSVVRFITQADNDVTAESDGKQVNLSVTAGSTYISLSGTG